MRTIASLITLLVTSLSLSLSLTAAPKVALQNVDLTKNEAIPAEDIQPLLPAIYQAAAVPSPSGEMFADQVRIEGLQVLATHHVEEGIQACVNYLGNQNPWASQIRTGEILKILVSYGTHSKATIPTLTQLADTFSKGEPPFPKPLSLEKEKDVRRGILKIEASTGTQTLIKIKK